MRGSSKEQTDIYDMAPRELMYEEGNKFLLRGNDVVV